MDFFGGLLGFNSGGKKVIERLVEAYGFTTRQALCDHLGVSKSTMATRYMRDIFPADWVIRYTIETGTSIQWLSFGTGAKNDSQKIDIRKLPKKSLIKGKIVDEGSYSFDSKFLSDSLKNGFIISVDNADYICDLDYEDVRDGKWLVNIDGEVSFRILTRLPGSRLHIASENYSFECSIKDIEVIAKVIISCTR